MNRAIYRVILALVFCFAAVANAETTEIKISLAPGEGPSMACKHVQRTGLFPDVLKFGRTPRQQVAVCTENVMTTKGLTLEAARHLPVGYSFYIQIQVPPQVAAQGIANYGEIGRLEERLAKVTAERDEARAGINAIDEKLGHLIEKGDSTLARIETLYEAKVAELNKANEAKITALNKAHDEEVAALNEEASDLETLLPLIAIASGILGIIAGALIGSSRKTSSNQAQDPRKEIAMREQQLLENLVEQKGRVLELEHELEVAEDEIERLKGEAMRVLETAVTAEIPVVVEDDGANTIQPVAQEPDAPVTEDRLATEVAASEDPSTPKEAPEGTHGEAQTLGRLARRHDSRPPMAARDGKPGEPTFRRRPRRLRDHFFN